MYHRNGRQNLPGVKLFLCSKYPLFHPQCKKNKHMLVHLTSNKELPIAHARHEEGNGHSNLNLGTKGLM